MPTKIVTFTNFCYNRNMDLIHSALGDIGLHEKEIDIYLALLSAGSSPASLLAKRTEMTRSTAQYNCKQLVKKKLATSIERNNTFIYTAEPPKKILENFQKKEEKLHQIMNPLLGMMTTSASIPRIQFYEGKDSLEKLLGKFAESLDGENEIVLFASTYKPDQDYQRYIDIFDKFIAKRRKKGNPIRIITEYSERAMELKKRGEKEGRRVMFVPENEFETPCVDIYAHKNKVYVFSLEIASSFAFVVENNSFANMIRIIFEMAWKEWDEMYEKK